MEGELHRCRVIQCNLAILFIFDLSRQSDLGDLPLKQSYIERVTILSRLRK